MQQMLDSNLLFTTTVFQAQLTYPTILTIHPSSAIKIPSQYRFTSHDDTSVICTTESIFTFELAAL